MRYTASVGDRMQVLGDFVGSQELRSFARFCRAQDDTPEVAVYGPRSVLADSDRLRNRQCVLHASADRWTIPVIAGELQSGNLADGILDGLQALEVTDVVLRNRARIVGDALDDRIARDSEDFANFAANEFGTFLLGETMKLRFSRTADEAGNQNVI